MIRALWSVSLRSLMLLPLRCARLCLFHLTQSGEDAPFLAKLSHSLQRLPLALTQGVARPDRMFTVRQFRLCLSDRIR